MPVSITHTRADRNPILKLCCIVSDVKKDGVGESVPGQVLYVSYKGPTCLHPLPTLTLQNSHSKVYYMSTIALVIRAVLLLDWQLTG